MPSNRNKRKAEAEARAARKAERKAGKRAGTRIAIDQERNEEIRSFLIVCEGKVTEPSYFEQFSLATARIEAIGEGKNTLTLVDAAIKLRDEAESAYDECWVVFDKDDFPSDDFDNAIRKAEANGLQVAYTNQAFEFWLLLHFDGHNGGGMHRDDCLVKLRKHLNAYGLDYSDDDKRVTSAIFDLFVAPTGRMREKEGTTNELEPETNEHRAIYRAEKILGYHAGKTPAAAESSTTVHWLVSQLNQYR